MLTIKQAKKTGFYGIVMGQRVKFVVTSSGTIYPEGRTTRNYKIAAGCTNEQLVSDVIARYNAVTVSRPRITLSE